MKVALVHDWLIGMRGGEKVLEAMAEMYPQADIYTLLCDESKISETLRTHTIHTSFLQQIPHATSFHRYLLPLMPLAIERFNLSSYDLVLSSSHCVAKGVITKNHTCHISYVHTPMRYAYEQFNDYFGSKAFPVRIGLQAAFHPIRTWDKATAKRVDHFIANSNWIAKRIKKHYDRQAVVIHPPVDTSSFQVMPLTEIDNYYLIVSAFVPYKKIDLAIEAFRKMPQKQLVVAGSGPELEKLKKVAPGNVSLVGSCSREQLIEYFNHCKAFIMPQLEDFGITTIEAQAAGRPIIAYGKGGALDSVIPLGQSETPTGVFFHEQHPQALMHAINKFEDHKEQFNPQLIGAHAQKFSKQEFVTNLTAFITKTIS